MCEMCTVVNFKQYGSVRALDQAFGPRWFYIGRSNPRAGLAQSPLANPFKVKDFGGQQGATLAHYRRWLWQQIRAGDVAVLAALQSITPETTLVCWCKPGPCHGDVVAAAAAWVQRQAQLVAFVSGHRDLSPAEFETHYQPQLDEAVAAGHHFVIGDAPGADRMTKSYLASRVSPSQVTVYHAGMHPRHRNGRFATKGWFTSQTAKDAAMTAVSDYDIAWVRAGKAKSGTARNLARRKAQPV